MTIKGRCYTHLDDFQAVDWPTAFVALPRIGDRVEGKGEAPRTRPTLHVVGITHRVRDGEPTVEIELNR